MSLSAFSSSFKIDGLDVASYAVFSLSFSLLEQFALPDDALTFLLKNTITNTSSGFDMLELIKLVLIQIVTGLFCIMLCIFSSRN